MTAKDTIPHYGLYGEQVDHQEQVPFNIQRIETFLLMMI